MNFVRTCAGISLLFFLGGAKSNFAIAATVRLQPVADTALIEIAPDNNAGGTMFVNAGTAGVAGSRNRGLFRFDFSVIPPNSKIKSAELQLEVSREPGMNPQSSSFALHRVLKPWGEGDKDSTAENAPGVGLSATIGEATWNSRFAMTTNFWSSPGASNDYSTVISSSTTVYGLSDFPRFASTAQMRADVQLWLGNSGTNYGWLLKTESESIARTARGFGSREFTNGDTNSPPYLDVEFVPPPTISEPQITNGQFHFSFFAEANEAYRVDFKSGMAETNVWQVLTNASALVSTNILISDPIATNAKYYRVVLQ